MLSTLAVNRLRPAHDVNKLTRDLERYVWQMVPVTACPDGGKQASTTSLRAKGAARLSIQTIILTALHLRRSFSYSAGSNGGPHTTYV